ncbi:MAG: transposase [Pseudobdellovibrionaceae bacterium]|jgi:REP element-mobilizing transposase RayT
MNQQLSFSTQSLRQAKGKSFGGVALEKRRKVARPLQVKAIHHVVFKSQKAVGQLSFYRHKNLVGSLLRERARKHFVEIKDFVNMGNHLHLKLKFKDRVQFQNFLRTFAAILARKITGAHRSQKFGKFWDGLVFTRILTSKFEELSLKGYFEGNHRERELGKSERERYLQSFQQFLSRLRKVRGLKYQAPS